MVVRKGFRWELDGPSAARRELMNRRIRTAPTSGHLAGKIRAGSPESRAASAQRWPEASRARARIWCWRRAHSGRHRRGDRRGFAPSAAAPPFSARFDLARLIKIDELAARILDAGGPARHLVGNAVRIRSLLAARPYRSRRHGARIMDLNLTANWRLIRAMEAY